MIQAIREIEVARGKVVVCIITPSGGISDELRLVASSLPREVPIVVIGSGGEQEASIDSHPVYLAPDLPTAFADTAPADLVLLMGRTRPEPGWLDALIEASESDATVAATGCLTTGDWIGGIDSPLLVDELQRWTQSESLRMRPRVPMLDAPCILFRRSALELIGPPDNSFLHPAAAVIDLTQRFVAAGMTLVLADELMMPADVSPIPESDSREIERRYPYLGEAVELARNRGSSPLRLALDRPVVAANASRKLSVTIDGSCFVDEIAGTQVHVLELLTALWDTESVRLRVLLLRDAPDWARAHIAGLEGVETIVWEDVSEKTLKTDIVHRPWQLGKPVEMTVLRNAGRCLVITQQDLINYRNPSYFKSTVEWKLFRSMVESGVDAATHVLFFSDHARRECVAQGLVKEIRSSVVHIGVKHNVFQPSAPSRPGWLKEGVPFLLCLGNDFLHKNRVFAMKVVRELITRHNWEGKLVMVGPRIYPGSSRARERALLDADPVLAKATVVGPPVTEGEKAWLLRHADAVLFPTIVEGFGLIPFEAAAAGTPSVFAWQSSLQELFPEDLGLIVPWDAAATADVVKELLWDEHLARRIVDGINKVADTLTWESTAEGVLAAYAKALKGEPRLSFQDADRDVLGGGGLIPVDVQLALTAISTRPYLSRPIFFLLARLYWPLRALRRILGSRFGR